MKTKIDGPDDGKQSVREFLRELRSIQNEKTKEQCLAQEKGQIRRLNEIAVLNRLWAAS